MKKAGCALLGCFGLLCLIAAVVLGLLLWLGGETGASPTQNGTMTAEEGPPGSDRIRLTFHFRDSEEGEREVRCEIRRSDLEREQAQFGVDEARLTEELSGIFRTYLTQEAERRGVENDFAIEVEADGSFRWSHDDPGGADPAMSERVAAFDAWLENEAQKSFASQADQHYRKRGLRLDGNTISVDYQSLVQSGTEPLGDCFQALRRLADQRSPIGLFLPFFQDLRYELPPVVDPQGRQTLGFRVPTAVLAQGAGDCDSKAAAFCALWRQLPARVLLVLVPEHALVAIEGKPGPGQASIRLGNRYFILCEVAGPARFPPGITDYSGSFEYILIEPAG